MLAIPDIRLSYLPNIAGVRQIPKSISEDGQHATREFFLQFWWPHLNFADSFLSEHSYRVVESSCTYELDDTWRRQHVVKVEAFTCGLYLLCVRGGNGARDEQNNTLASATFFRRNKVLHAIAIRRSWAVSAEHQFRMVAVNS